jgi:acetylornithine/succinyldiaminopimelate/putrescine aminotransferase
MKPNIELAGLLVKHSFGDKVFFCNSGTEASEAAIKFARKWATARNPKAFHVLSFSEGFHGRTYGGLSATAQPKFHAGFGPMVPGFHYAPFNDIAKTRAELRKREWAAIIVEPVQGESGFNQATTEFLWFLRTYATQHHIALIFDEVQCGLGRTGTLWAYEQHGLQPDMMTLAKPIGGGLPLGAVVCTSDIAQVMAPGAHGTTFGGNPLACALGCVVLKKVARKVFLDGVEARGTYLAGKLATSVLGKPGVTGIVGIGLMVGVRFTKDPGPIVDACRKRGLLLVKAGNNTVRFLPPLTISKTEIDTAVKIFTGVVADTKVA